MRPTTSAPSPAREARALLLTVACAALLSGCGNNDLNAGDAEQKIARALQRETADTPMSVDCPSGVEVKKGRRFTCRLTARDGSSADVKVLLTDADGHFSYRVDPATLEQSR